MCAVICRKATFTLSVSAITLPDANFPTSRAQNRGFCALLGSGSPVFGLFEHKIEVFVRFRPPEPSFLGISSTKSGFLCSFTKLDVGLGDFPAESGVVATAAVATIVAPAQPILPLTLPPLHLRSRFSCGVAALAEPSYLRRAMPSAVACRRLPPVPPVLPLLPPLHLRSRCTCAADTTAAYHRRTCRRVRVRVSFRLGRRS